MRGHMEDWEQFFDEKSRRRAGKERQRRLARLARFALIGVFILAAVVILVLLRR